MILSLFVTKHPIVICPKISMDQTNVYYNL